jgi:uncharacterized DUF497 family protein
MAKGDFRWIEWNRDHATKHGVTITEIESVVRNNRNRKIGDDKRMAVGRGVGGRIIQVVFLFDDDGTIFVIHAMQVKR